MIYLLVSVRLYVHPSALYPIDNLSICSQSFFKYCIHIVIRDEWYRIVNGQKLSIFNRVTALVHTGKIISGIFTVIILSIRTDRSEQTVQTQIRLLLMEQSDQGLLCLLFCLHLLNAILQCKIQLFQLYDNYGNYFRCPNF